MAEVSFPKGQSDEFTLLQPIWEPYNPVAEALCDELIADLGLPTTVGKLPRYRAFMASLLVICRRKDLVGIPHKNDYWSPFPLLGRSIANACTGSLAVCHLLHKVEGTGKRVFQKSENNTISYDALTSLYIPSDELIALANTTGAEFIETGRPYVKVNAAETHSEKHIRERYNRSKPSVGLSTLPEASHVVINSDKERLAAIATFWRSHPLRVSKGLYAASVTRIYHNGRTDAGGRLYGYWTNQKSEHRKTYTIDGEATAQIDVTGSQPTLLSALLGIPFQIVPADQKPEIWYDPYGEIAFSFMGTLGDEVWENWGEGDGIVPYRNLFKKISSELIGTGNPGKLKPSKETRAEFNLSDEEWITARDFLLRRIPALKKLDKEYINGANFLSYHESQIMMRTLEECLSRNLPAYPVHDCLIVKESDVEKGAEAYGDACAAYLEALGVDPIKIGFTIEVDGKSKRTQGSFLF